MRAARRLVHALAVVLTLMVGATAAAVIVSQTAWFKNWLRGYIVRSANAYLNGTISIERLGGNLFFGVEMENIGVSMDGEQLVAVKDLGLDYNIFQLLTRGLSVDSIRLDKPVIYLRRDGDTWTLSRLIKKQESEADRSGPAKPISIDEIGISGGSVVVDQPVGTSGVNVPKRIDNLDAKVSFKYEPVRYSIEITHVSFRASEPALALNALSGGVSVKDDTVFVDRLALRTAETSLSFAGAIQHYLTKPVFNLQMSSDKLTVTELAGLFPSLAGVKLQPAFDIKLDGPLDRLGVEMNARSSAGALSGKLVADFESPGQSATGTLSIRNLNLAPILNDPAQKSDLTADTKFDLRVDSFDEISSLRGTVTASARRLDAAGYSAGPVDATAKIAGRRMDLNARGAAYGARATTSGRVTLPDFSATNKPTTFDLRGRIANLDLRRMPKSLNVPAAATDVAADYHVVGTIGKDLGPIVEGDARFHPSTVAGARIAGGTTAAVSLNGKDASYSADASVEGLDLQRLGNEFNIPALADDRYRTAINGHIVARGRGTAVQTLNATATGTLTETSVLGGTIPSLTFDAGVADESVHVKANGTFHSFDPAAVTGKRELKGTVGGRFDVDATAREVSAGVTPESLTATGRIDLDESRVGGLDIARAALDGDYRNSTGDIRTLEVVGRDLNVDASGTLALNDSGQSNLRVHADSPDLGSVGKLADVAVTGIGKLDATITGNRTALTATGNVTGDGVKYDGNGALAASTDFTARVPDLDVERATVSATTHATFVSVAGQNINELTARTDYADKQVAFDAIAKQPERSLSATGALLLHPDHQEVHLKSLGLQSQGVQWQTAAGSSAAINYANDSVQVEGLRLVNGDQEMTADGRFGRRGDALNVTLKNIDVATVDALLLREPQLTGRLNASAKVTGEKENPSVEATFSVEKGGFRQFKYDTFGGTATYASNGVDVDARLQQSPTTWLSVKGYAPITVEASRKEYALHVDSSAIDLGLVQGFTTAVKDVTGTVQAKIDVTGAVGDPRPTGSVTLQNAAFTVEPTGVTYTGLEGRLDLQQDKVHVDEIRLVDNHKSPMTIHGDLAIHEGEVGGVSIAIKAADFKVIDNKLGNVRVNSDLRIAGQLNAPRIEGDLGISTGVVNLDPILAQMGSSAYATKATEFETRTLDNAGQAAAPSSAFEQLYAYVHVTVPNDLVIKAADIRSPDAPIGLGALNLTLGGDLIVHKAPWDQPRIYGDVTTIRGNYDFQGRRFDILRDGRVRFEGTDGVDPALDVRTQRTIQAVVANVNVRGTLQHPEVVLTSSPPLEEADILSLIVFNQPINQLAEGDQVSLAQRAQGIALGAAAGQLAQSIGSVLGVDTFELNLAPDNGGAASVTIGQQIGQNLFVKVEQGLGDQSQTNVILEYELTKWLRFRTNMLQGATTQAQLFQRQQGSGADLLFFFGF